MTLSIATLLQCPPVGKHRSRHPMLPASRTVCTVRQRSCLQRIHETQWRWCDGGCLWCTTHELIYEPPRTGVAVMTCDYRWIHTKTRHLSARQTMIASELAAPFPRVFRRAARTTLQPATVLASGQTLVIKPRVGHSAATCHCLQWRHLSPRSPK